MSALRTFVAIYLTIGAAHASAFWMLAAANGTSFERLIEKQRALSFVGKCLFWWQFGLGLVLLYPLTWTLYALADAERKESWARYFRREYIDDDRMRRALTPQMPAPHAARCRILRPEDVEAPLRPLPMAVPCAITDCQQSEPSVLVLVLEQTCACGEPSHLFLGLCPSHIEHRESLEYAVRRKFEGS